MSKVKFEESWAELRPKFCLLRQYCANICNRIENLSKTGQEKTIVISTFVCFLTATGKV